MQTKLPYPHSGDVMSTLTVKLSVGREMQMPSERLGSDPEKMQNMFNQKTQMAKHYYPNRLLCDVLEEMRKCHETRNYSYLPGLIEEVQSLANRMEAGLEDKKDLRQMSEERHYLHQTIKALREEKAALEKELGKEPEKDDDL